MSGNFFFLVTPDDDNPNSVLKSTLLILPDHNRLYVAWYLIVNIIRMMVEKIKIEKRKYVMIELT